MHQEFLEKYIQCQISYYIALHYIFENNQVKQALVILQDCQYKIEQTVMFFTQSGIQGEKQAKMCKFLESDLIKKVEFAQCKCHSKYLMQQYQQSKGVSSAKVDSAPSSSNKVQFDNLSDLLFDGSSIKPRDNLDKRVSVGRIENGKASLNVLEDEESLKITKVEDDSAFDISKVKINKQFKLVSTLPKLRSVPANPQVFDMAGGYVTYPNF